MKIRKVFGVIFLGLVAVAGTPALAQNINAAGATFPYPIYSKWFDEYHKMHPAVQINYQSIRSGGGITPAFGSHGRLWSLRRADVR